MKDTCNETTSAFFLQTHLEIGRKNQEETEGGGVRFQHYQTLMKQLTSIAESQQTLLETSISLFSP